MRDGERESTKYNEKATELKMLKITAKINV